MTLLEFPAKRILGRFIPAPLPPAGSFEGQRVLVTGGTAGLGLAAAIHFARLGAEVLITCRDLTRGEQARARVEADANAPGKVTVWELDMVRYASCVALVDGLKGWCREKGVGGGLDVAVLNAGRIDPRFALSPEGWEQTIQVNALSTTLLGLLLTAWMREERREGRRSAPAHLVFVTSRDHLYPDITPWLDWAAANERGILGHFSDPANWPKSVWAESQPNYGNSKTLVMHAIQEISKLATTTTTTTTTSRGENGSEAVVVVVDVVVNSVCPGLVNTDIGRHIAETSWWTRLLTPVYMAVLGKPPDAGARLYVLAAARGVEDHGKFGMAWLSEEEYDRKAVANMTGEHARAVHDVVWREIRDDLLAKVPRLGELLPELVRDPPSLP